MRYRIRMSRKKFISRYRRTVIINFKYFDIKPVSKKNNIELDKYAFFLIEWISSSKNDISPILESFPNL